MRTRLIIGTLLATLAASAPAAASTRHFEGTFAGDADASIAMDVVVRHGEPRKVRDLMVTGLDYVCERGETGERSVAFPEMRVFDSARDGLREFQGEVYDEAGTSFLVGGLMRPSPRSVKGGLAFVFAGPTGVCESAAAGVGRYVAR